MGRVLLQLEYQVCHQSASGRQFKHHVRRLYNGASGLKVQQGFHLRSYGKYCTFEAEACPHKGEVVRADAYETWHLENGS